METTEGSTFAAMPAKERGLRPSVETGDPATVNPAPVASLESWSSATPMPTPAPPKTSAESPAAAAGATQPGRWRCGVSPGGGGEGSATFVIGVVGRVASAGSCAQLSGQNSSLSLILVTLRVISTTTGSSGVLNAN